MAYESCCTCAKLLSNILPQYDEKTEKQITQDRRLDCCGRLQDPPAYFPPSSPRPAPATLAYSTDAEDPPAYSALENRQNGEKSEQTVNELADDVLHFVNPSQDTIPSLALRYAVPPNALRKKNNLYADHLLAARKAILIPGEYYKGVSLSPQPIDGEEEELRKSKIRRWMVSSHYDIDAAIEAYFSDEKWEQEHPMASSSKGKSTLNRTRRNYGVHTGTSGQL
ncbi:MAG: hypothetical protein Q9181_000456 [Wetmoreana brouardii]